MANWSANQNVRELTDNWKETTVIKRWPSLLASGYWGFHRGKPVPFADWAPSWSRRLLGVSSRKTSVRWWGAIRGFLRRALPGTSRQAQKSSPYFQLRLAPLLRVAYYPKWRPRKANTGFSRRRKTPTPTGRLKLAAVALTKLAVKTYRRVPIVTTPRK